MIQDTRSNNKIKENKYKILRMSLLLGSDDNRNETLNNFEDAAREIDTMNDEIYLHNLEQKFYDTITLQEEAKKLEDLVDYIGGRVEQRISLLSDFSNITGYDLTNLPPIKYYDKLDDYKERLKYIKEYLKNTSTLEKINQEIKEDENKLNDAYLTKATKEEKNEEEEENLLRKFKTLLKNEEILKEVDENNIDSILNGIINLVEESKKSLEIFNKSYNTLTNSGISSEEQEEYKSYVDSAKIEFYNNKEQEYLLRIYKLLLTKEKDYQKFSIKCENLSKIIEKRLQLRSTLGIEETDLIASLYDNLERIFEDLEIQKETIKKIESLSSKIDINQSQKQELEQANQKVEILSLLREFCMLDTYNDIEENKENEEEPITPSIEEKNLNDTYEKTEDLKIEIPMNPIETLQSEKTSPFDITSSKKEEATPIINPPKDNQIIKIEDAGNLNVDFIQSKATKVMKRVGEMLGIKLEEERIVSFSNQEEVTPAPSSNQVVENPLFNNNIAIEETGEKTKEEIKPEENFWFNSKNDSTEVDKFPVSNDDFFANNNIPDLNFPDLKIDNVEGKQ